MEEKLNKDLQGAPINALSVNNVLAPERVTFIENSTKENALKHLADLLNTDRRVKDKHKLISAIFKREDLMSTGIGLGIGVPHVRINSVEDIVMAIGICRPAIMDYESLDDEPICIICMIAAHSDQHAKHIKLLSAVSKLLKNREIREKILNAVSEQEVYNIFIGNNHV